MVVSLLDLGTLVVMNSLATAFMAVMMTFLARSMPDEACLKDWALAGWLLFLRSALAFWPDEAPGIGFVRMAGNACALAAHVAVIVGVRRHLGLRSSTRAVVVAGALTWALAVVLMLGEVPRAWRLAQVLVSLAAVDLYGAVTFWRHRRARAGAALPVLAGLEAAYCVQALVRTAIALLMSPEQRAVVFKGHELQKIGELWMFVFVLLTSALCVALVLNKQAQALRRHAQTDPMTGWLNRRSMAEVLAAELERARRTQGSLHLVTFDIDHFKAVNDRHGHDVGDEAIRHVTRLAELELRGYDHKFRTGGEEFVVCVPAQSADTAAHVAERLRRRIAGEPLAARGGPIAITVSVGYADARADEGWEAVLKRADEALYQAKQGGRNRVFAWRLETPLVVAASAASGAG